MADDVEVGDRHAGEDVYISVDVEADGRVPLVNSMLSLGACVAGAFDGRHFRPSDPTLCTFYAELKPVSDEFDPDALEAAHLDRTRVAAEGEDPATAMARFAAWVGHAAGAGRAVLVAYPASFDWPWIAAYLGRYAPAEEPFGFSRVIDMKTMYLTKARVRIGKAAKGSMPPELLSARPHTHNALDDAVEQAELFANLWEWPGLGPDH